MTPSDLARSALLIFSIAAGDRLSNDQLDKSTTCVELLSAERTG